MNGAYRKGVVSFLCNILYITSHFLRLRKPQPIFISYVDSSRLKRSAMVVARWCEVQTVIRHPTHSYWLISSTWISSSSSQFCILCIYNSPAPAFPNNDRNNHFTGCTYKQHRRNIQPQPSFRQRGTDKQQQAVIRSREWIHKRVS